MCDHPVMENDFLLSLPIRPSITGRHVSEEHACPSASYSAASAEGMSTAEILAEYPTLTLPGIHAALQYAAALAREESIALSPAVA